MRERPITTLFMLMSLDGKISTGDTDVMDIDNDFKKISGVKNGIKQYYQLEQKTDFYSLNSGRVLEKIGINRKADQPKKIDVGYIVVDNKPHLDKNGILYLINKGRELYIITTNKRHPAYELKKEFPKINILKYRNKIDLSNVLKKLKQECGIKRITIQTGGIMNAAWLRNGLIDYVSIVVAPALIGGKDTSSLIDGESIHAPKELSKIKALRLAKCHILKNSYIHLQYKVNNL